jgi:hypothetical protein
MAFLILAVGFDNNVPTLSGIDIPKPMSLDSRLAFDLHAAQIAAAQAHNHRACLYPTTAFGTIMKSSMDGSGTQLQPMYHCQHHNSG